MGRPLESLGSEPSMIGHRHHPTPSAAKAHLAWRMQGVLAETAHTGKDP